jgi:hypothetical protein
MENNIHIIPTDKPSRLFIYDGKLGLAKGFQYGSDTIQNQHIHITSDEEIKEGVDQWYLDKVLNKPYNSGGAQYSSKQDVIILTTDTRLAPDVQKISDEFLEWFVKNPSCEKVEVKPMLSNNGRALFGYKIIIPKEEPKHPKVFSENGDELFFDEQGNLIKEEPKQETLEEAYLNKLIDEANKEFTLDRKLAKEVAIKFSKWQQERSYSEEDLKSAFKIGFNIGYGSPVQELALKNEHCEKWFEQFKNK